MENKNYTVTITDGTGSVIIPNGSYSVSSSTNGYDDSTITPNTVTIVDNTEIYEFVVEATGTLTLHVTEEGTAQGTPIVGAKFIRCDQDGNTYGTEITTNELGNAVFSNVPYAASDAPIIYYKQTLSDGDHNFDGTLKNIQLTDSTGLVEVQNPIAVTKTFKLNDKNYSGLVINSSTMTLS